jgi:protein-S-isoprenylcysteine O-methyltransferase Ste14
MTSIRYRTVFLNASLVVLFAAFAYANFARWQDTGRPVGLGAVLLEGFTALLFVFRRSPHATSGRALAWVAAPVGSFAMLLARPVAHPNEGPFGTFQLSQLLGFAIAIAALGALGRSFGIVAANRGIKTGGLYAVVRHPAYLGYAFSYLGYVCENPSMRNLTLLAVSSAGQLVRIGEEERMLARDSAYERYRTRVRYRLIPRLY